jgi:GxxExxY protein
LDLRGIPHGSEVALPLEYKGVQIGKAYFIDLLIEDAVVVELASSSTSTFTPSSMV